jgi:putative SOS response-associated peptidase YedK
MCNDFGNKIPYSDYLTAFSETGIPVKWPSAVPNLEPRDDICRPIVPRSFDGLKTGRTSFFGIEVGLSITRPKGLPVINFRSEGRRFPVGRCLVPASHFYEFTGTKSPKTCKFTKAGEDWFCFAGLWRPMAGVGEAFTLLTTEPSPDVAPIDDRQMVVLERSDWSAWLEQTGNEASLLRALPAGSSKVEQVR